MISIKDAEEVLKKEYERDNYVVVLDDVLLPDFKKELHPVEFHNNLFENVTELGESKTCEVTVYEVILKEGAEKRRVAITQEMFRVLRGQAVNNAIVAFANADKRNYRFSLLTSKYEFDGNKVVKILSNPRRYSYSLGYGTKTKTAYKFLIEKGKVNSLEDLISRFSVEVVNKEFYKEIALSFTELIGGERDGKTFEKELNIYGVTDRNKYAEFAVRLIGRIMFCWFLKEKKSEENNPLIPVDVLAKDKISSSHNYYHDILEPLFFELLNTNQKRRKGKFMTKDVYKQIPYLNGGLFSPHTDDHYKYDTVNQSGQYGIVTIPNEWFEKFYDILSQYNFTVDENTAYDIELSIDPEMLGRIFENLLAEINPETGENAKKSTGSFYTPRDIVDYMVDNSILEYLKTKTEIDEVRLKALISYSKEDDDLAVFDNAEKEKIVNALYNVKVLDPACGSGAFPIGMLQKIVYMLQEIDPEANMWFEEIVKGAPIYVRKAFEEKFSNGELNYIRKLTVIEKSIYGIDIQPIAVEIARLRCFLSLVIEQKVNDKEENRGVHPLPSLDFKFIIANSLIKLPDESSSVMGQKYDQTSMFENVNHIDELKRIREEYFNADSEDKARLREEFADVQKSMLQQTISMSKMATDRYTALFNWSPFKNEPTSWFDPEWMFGIKDGFDIVIGNPPYIGEKNHKEIFREVANSNLGKRFYQGKMDYFYFFIHAGIDLLSNTGELVFITTNYYLTATGAKKLRNDIKTRTKIRKLVNFNELHVFESAIGQHNMITMLTRCSNKEILCDSYFYENKEDKDLGMLLANPNYNMKNYKVEQENLFDGEDCYIRQAGVKSSGGLIGNILDKMASIQQHLGDITNVNQGVLTGCDTVAGRNIELIPKESKKIKDDAIFVFDLTNERDMEVINSFSNGKELLKDFFKNSDISRYQCSKNANKKLLYYQGELDKDKFPDVYLHLQNFESLLKQRLITYNEHYHWTAIHRPREESIFYGPKLVVPYRTKENSFAFNDKEWFCRTDSYVITAKSEIVNLFYILGVLNSKLGYIWLYNRGKRKGEILELFQVPLCEIPIAKANNDIENKISNLAKEITSKKQENINNDTSELEHEIDLLVYEAYGLTDEEIALVEDSVK